jgi:hypothetical protein
MPTAWPSFAGANAARSFLGVAPACLYAGPPLLFFDSTLHATACGLRLSSWSRSLEGAQNERPNFSACVVEVHPLVACPLARDEQPTVRVESSSCDRAQAGLGRRVESGDAQEIDPKFDFAGDFVDVLPSRAARTDRMHFHGVSGHDDAWADFEGLCHDGESVAL